MWQSHNKQTFKPIILSRVRKVSKFFAFFGKNFCFIDFMPLTLTCWKRSLEEVKVFQRWNSNANATVTFYTNSFVRGGEPIAHAILQVCTFEVICKNVSTQKIGNNFHLFLQNFKSFFKFNFTSNLDRSSHR